MTTKTCAKCNESKSISEYTRDKASKDGLRYWCKLCASSYGATWRIENKEQIKEKGRLLYKSMPLEFSAWVAMKNRCNSRNHENYKYYGARGISVCLEWSSFDSFLRDMGRKPTPKHQIHRIDSNVGYTPTNCSWVLAAKHALLHRSITPEVVGDIKHLKATGCKQVNIAKILGVSGAMVSEIVNGKRYADEGLLV